MRRAWHHVRVFPVDWLVRLLSSATAHELAVNLPYAVAFACVGAEVAWLARRPGPARAAVLRSAATATSMALGALAVGVGYTAALRFLWNLVATQQWDAGRCSGAATPCSGCWPRSSRGTFPVGCTT